MGFEVLNFPTYELRFWKIFFPWKADRDRVVTKELIVGYINYSQRDIFSCEAALIPAPSLGSGEMSATLGCSKIWNGQVRWV